MFDGQVVGQSLQFVGKSLDVVVVTSNEGFLVVYFYA